MSSSPPPLPRDKDSLLREVDASIRIKDIRTLDRLRDTARVRWWESGLILLLFASGLGFLTSVVFLMTTQSDKARLWLEKSTLFWFLPLVFSIILTLEIILTKIAAMRRLNEFSAALIADMRKEIDALRKEIGALRPADGGEEPE
jgi:hypothetical protein